LPSDRVLVSGIPVMASFLTRQAKKPLYAKFGLEPNLPLVLLSAGAFGLMNAADILKILGQIRRPCQVVVICGRNRKLQADLEKALEVSGGISRNRYIIVGYTDAMHEYLKLADVYIGKPGGLSTSECLACGVPMVIWNPIPGQEMYNAYHLLENGVGVLPDNALTIGYKVDHLLGDPAQLKAMREKALSMAKPGAASAIVEAMLCNEDETPVKPFKKAP